MGWVSLGLGTAAGAGGQVGGRGEGVGRGLGGVGDMGCRVGAIGGVGITGLESIVVSSRNPQRFTV